MKYSIAKNVSCQEHVNHEAKSFRQFFESITAEAVLTSKKGSVSVFCAPSIDGTKSKETMPVTELLVIDGDSGLYKFDDDNGKNQHCTVAPETAIKAVTELGLEAGIYSSFSNMNIPAKPESLSEELYEQMSAEWHRWRLILPLSRPVDAEELKALYLEAVRQLNAYGCMVEVNSESQSLVQYWFLPSYPDESRLQMSVTKYLAGEALPVDEWLESISQMVEPEKTDISKVTSSVTTESLDQVENACLKLIRELKGDETYSISDYLIEQGFTTAGDRLSAPDSSNPAGVTILDVYTVISGHQHSDPYVAAGIGSTGSGAKYNLTDILRYDCEAPSLWFWLKRWAESGYADACHPLADGKGGKYQSLTEAFREPECCLFEGREEMPLLSLIDDEEPEEESDEVELIELQNTVTVEREYIDGKGYSAGKFPLNGSDVELYIPERPKAIRSDPVVGVTYDRWGKPVDDSFELDAADYMTLPVSEIITKPVKFPSPLLTGRQGILRDLINYNLNRANRPNLEASIGASLVTLCTMSQGKYRSDLRDWLQLSVVPMGRTTSGKDSLLRGITDLLGEMGLEGSLLDDVSSDVSIKAELSKAPNHCGLVVEDEFGLKVQASNRSNDKLSAMMRKLLLELQGAGLCGSTLKGKSVRERGMSVERIKRPHFSTYATSTVETVMEIFSSDAAATGDLNRHLFMMLGESSDHPDEELAEEATEHLFDCIVGWHELMRTVEENHFQQAGQSTPLNQAVGKTTDTVFELPKQSLITLSFDAEAKELSHLFRDRFQRETLPDGSDNPVFAELEELGLVALWGRAEQWSKVIACLVALSDFYQEFADIIDGDHSKVQDVIKDSVKLPVTAELIVIGQQLVFYSCALASRLFGGVAHGRFNKYVARIKELMLHGGGSIGEGKLDGKLQRDFAVDYQSQDFSKVAKEHLLKITQEAITHKGGRGGSHYVSVDALGQIRDKLLKILPEDGLSVRQVKSQLRSNKNGKLIYDSKGQLKQKQFSKEAVDCLVGMIVDGSSKELQYLPDEDLIFPA